MPSLLNRHRMIVTNNMTTWSDEYFNAIVFEQSDTKNIHGKKIDKILNVIENMYGARVQRKAIDIWIDSTSIQYSTIKDLEGYLNMKFRYLAAHTVKPIYEDKPHIVQVLSFTDKLSYES